MTSFEARCLVFTSKHLPQYAPPRQVVSFSESRSRGRVVSIMSDGLWFVLITSSGMLVIHIKHIIDKAGGAVFVPERS